MDQDYASGVLDSPQPSVSLPISTPPPPRSSPSQSPPPQFTQAGRLKRLPARYEDVKPQPSPSARRTMRKLSNQLQSGSSKSDRLSFTSRDGMTIFIQFGGPWRNRDSEEHGHLLHDVELLDEASLKGPRNQIINADRHSRSSTTY